MKGSVTVRLNASNTTRCLAYRTFSQRFQFKKKNQGDVSQLCDDRIKQLEAIGFVWKAKADPEWQERDRERKRSLTNDGWQENYEKLIVYKKKHGAYSYLIEVGHTCSDCTSLLTFKLFIPGHCQVPKLYSTDQRLSSWVFRQRRHYVMRQEGDTLGMTDERFFMLEKVRTS